MGFEVQHDQLALTDGAPTPVLRLVTGAGANNVLVAPGLGANVLSWRETLGGQPIELLWQDFSSLTAATAIKHGIPVLFPFVNRLRAGTFTWQGQQRQLTLNCPQDRHAIHGFAWQRPWTVVETIADAASATVRLRLDLQNEDPWPGPLRIEMAVRYSPATLMQVFLVTNLANRSVPWAFGLHPYFRLRPESAEVFANLPADRLTHWELRDYLPVGGRLPLRGKFMRLAKASRKPWGSNRFDDVLHVEGQGPASWCLASANGWQIELEALGGFRDFVVFTPPHREAVCLEPYTAVTDAFHLHSRGLESGLKALQPGESWHGRVVLRFKPPSA